MQIANWIDGVIIAFISLSAFMSFMRGFTKEIFSLITWILAVWVSLQYFEKVQPWFADFHSPLVQKGLAFSLLFFSILIVGAVLNYCISRFLRLVGFGFFDRLLGLLFGVVRGTAIVGLAVLFLSATPLSQDKLWQESKMIVHISSIVESIKKMIPPDTIKRFIELTKNYPFIRSEKMIKGH